MAYDKEKILEQAKQAIKDNKLYFIEDIVAWIPISKKTLYEWWPADSDECNSLKELLEENKIKTKSEIRSKLFKSEKAAELLALYRLICTKEEHQLLNQQYIDHTTKGETLNAQIDLTKYTDEELRTIAELQRKGGISKA